MESWHKKLGYYKNPFLCNPHKEQFPFLGNEDEVKKAVYYVSSGSIIFIQGEKGSGKTKFLKKIIKEFPKKIIYINALKLTKTINIENVLRKRKGFFGSLRSKPPRDAILILDNVNELPLVNMERLKYYYDQGHIKSIIFAGEKFSKANLPESIHSRIGKRVITIKEMSDDDAIKMISVRLGEELADEDSVISQEFVKTIFNESKKNPRMFLVNLHRVFEEMVMNKEEKISENHLDVLKDKLDEEEIKEFEEELGVEYPGSGYYDKKGNIIIKIGEYYRNVKEDIFCSNCGAIVSVDDFSCPECKAFFEEEKEEDNKEKKELEKKLDEEKEPKEELKKEKKVTKKTTNNKKKETKKKDDKKKENKSK